MTLRLEINGVDFTSRWRPYESRWTMRAWNGESFASEFVLDDDGTIIHADLSARKIVTVWENATGSDICLYRGRISNKHLGMSPSQVHNDMRWTVEAEDYNIELRGIRVNNAVRPAETDEARFEAIRVAFLNGAASSHPTARDSTDLDNTFLGMGLSVDLEAETYTDTDPFGVFTRIVEVTGRTFFVFLTDAGTGELYYGTHTDETYVSDIEITDAGFADSADDIDVYAAYRGPNAGEHAGQNVMTGGALRWGDGNLYEDSDIAGAEAVYDKWEETFTNEFVEHSTQADNMLNKLVGLSDEDFTYLATIDMQPQHVHRIRAGMMVLLTRFRANKPVQGYVRAVQMQVEPVLLEDAGNPIYRVTLDLGRAQGRSMIPRGRTKPGPYPPTQPTEGGCSRLYFSTAAASISTQASDASWADDGSAVVHLLKLAPDDTIPVGGGSSDFIVGVNVAAGSYVRDDGLDAYQITDADLLAAIQAGGLTAHAQMTTRSRHGIGVSEAAQDDYQTWLARVYRAGTGFIGTLWGLTGGGTRFLPQSTFVNRSWAATSSAVAGAALNDWIVFEFGARHVGPTSGAAGAYYRLTSDSGVGDLPVDEVETAVLNSWIEICAAGSSGDSTEPVGLPGSGSPGGTGTGVGGGSTGSIFSPIDHIHAHGFLADDTIHLHDADQIDGLAEQLVISLEEEDGTPSGIFDTLKVPNGSLTDNDDGSASLALAAAVHAHDPATPGFHGVLVHRSTDFTTTNSNDSIPDFDNAIYDTDAVWEGVTNPDRLTIPAAWDGLLAVIHAHAGWTGHSGTYIEMKLYRNGTASEANLICVTQHATNTASPFQELTSPPIAVATGDYFTITLRTPTSQTAIEYDTASITFGAYLVGGGLTEDDVMGAGRWEVVVSGSAPPVAVTNEAEDDWVYGWVSG